ncbi:keratin, type I cytoskeletal 9 isoform X2 [Octopus sinensis]|uniref:Keratin, type I cytoskeletal 9 isoform X2 n=1 Tax=Octopus sinensis TaxID=2607531 RepID=A0A6P7TSD8_9MOLL|nr:keratin, type I cytoskeletal 9 isoform X2 [Octopus sinensis]
MSTEDLQQTIANDDDDEVEEVTQGDMETGTLPLDDEEKVEGDVPMEDSNAEEKKDDAEKKEEEDDNTFNLRRPYPNLLTIHKLKLEDIKVAVSELSDYWDDSCLTIRYIKEKSGIRKGFMRMKFPSEEAAEVVFNKLMPMEINGKTFEYEPTTEGNDGKDKDGKGNKKDYSLYVNNIPQGVTVKEVQALFPQARNVVIPLNEEDQNQGYALVECHSLQEAETMLAESKELKLKENVLTCDLISHTSKDDDKKSKKHQNNQQNKKGRFSNSQNRRNHQMNKKGKRPQQMQQMQQRKQRWSPERRQQGRKPLQFMQKGRMDGGRRQLMDGGGQWNQGGQNVTAALSQTSELLKGLTSLLGQQLLSPNQMGGQGDGQYGNQSWGQGMDQGGNYGGFQSGGGGGGGGGGGRGFGNDSMNYGNYDLNSVLEVSTSSPSASASRYSGDEYTTRNRPYEQHGGRFGGSKRSQRTFDYNSSGNYGGGGGGGGWGSSYRGYN